MLVSNRNLTRKVGQFYLFSRRSNLDLFSIIFNIFYYFCSDLCYLFSCSHFWVLFAIFLPSWELGLLKFVCFNTHLLLLTSLMNFGMLCFHFCSSWDIFLIPLPMSSLTHGHEAYCFISMYHKLPDCLPVAFHLNSIVTGNDTWHDSEEKIPDVIQPF